MKMMLPATLLALVACSSQTAPPVANQVTANSEAAAEPVAGPPPVVAATDSGAAPGQGEMKTFRDWTVACDNVKRCAMASLGPDMGDFPQYTLQVTRAAGPSGGYEIAVEALQDDSAKPAALTIDGRRFAFAPDGLAGEGAGAIAAALGNARSVAVLDGKGGTTGTVSPAGASAALRYIDAQQGRAGGVTATVARGPRAADTVPDAPAVPIVLAPALDAAVTRPTPKQLADMRRIGRCEERMQDATTWKPRLAALGARATLVLLPCSAGAYNEIDALFVIRDGQVAPADVDAPSGFEETGADSQTPVHSIVNGDVANGLVTSYAKGRGLGDCGVSQTFAWDGRRLRLTEQTEMGECRGNPHYLRTWIAKVERR